MRSRIENAFTKSALDSIFLDKTYLDSRWIPTQDYLIGREAQCDFLAAHFSSLLKHQLPNSLTVYGKAGVGKTTNVMSTLNQIKLIADKKKLKVQIIYINAKNLNTEFKIMLEVTNKLGILYQGCFLNVYYENVQTYMKSTGKSLILVLDEVDSIRHKDINNLIYNLYEASTQTFNVNKTGICVVSITNRLNFLDALEPKTRSRFMDDTLIFEHYNAIELKNLLMPRAEASLSPDAYDESVINRCAALAAQDQGDARMAIDLLRTAGECAEKKQKKHITDEDINDARNILVRESLGITAKSLQYNEKILLYCLLNMAPRKGFVENDGLMAVSIYNEYVAYCNRNKITKVSYRRTNQYINNLEQLGIIEQTMVSLGRHGRGARINVCLQDSALQKLKEDLNEEFS